MSTFHYYIRKTHNQLMLIGLCLFGFIAVLPFFFIVWYVIIRGGNALNWELLTELPGGPGQKGSMGIANGILGSAIMVGLASLVGTPWGIFLGICLNEYRHSFISKVLRFIVDLSISTPSIIIGIFVYSILVIPFGFSAYAGSLALMIIFVPTVARATEEILALIPNHIREAALALGLARWKMIVRILLPGMCTLLITGVILAIARIAGETAPLLFTALGNNFFSKGLNEPIASLPVQIYEFAKSGFPSMESMAWGGALILIAFVFVINFVIRLTIFLITKRYKK